MLTAFLPSSCNDFHFLLLATRQVEPWIIGLNDTLSSPLINGFVQAIAENWESGDKTLPNFPAVPLPRVSPLGPPFLNGRDLGFTHSSCLGQRRTNCSPLARESLHGLLPQHSRNPAGQLACSALSDLTDNPGRQYLLRNTARNLGCVLEHFAPPSSRPRS
ncbi:hypothetical protein WG66_002780 [Moniliophthora roreri]|nr:hypothetical protein WG66_002780 [Moniliophthora roreri]